MMALYIAMPILGQHKAVIERFASQITHHSVKITSSKSIWLDTEPALMLNDVTILDEKTMQPALKIAQLQIGLKIFASLWQRKPIIGYLSANGATIHLRQSQDNHITADGLEALQTENTPTKTHFADFLNPLTTINTLKLTNITVFWQKPNGNIITIPNATLALYNSWYQHHGDLRLSQTDVGALLHGYDYKGWQIKSGLINTLSLHWGFDSGILNYLKGSINAKQFNLSQPTSQPQPWQLQSLMGHFNWQGKLPDRWTLKIQNLTFRLNDQSFAEKKLQMNAFPIKKGGILYTVRASCLPLAPLYFPLTKLGLLTDTQKSLLKTLNLQGNLKNIYFEYPQNPIDTQPSTRSDLYPSQNWKFSAEIQKLNLSPWQKIPGIQQLTGYLQLSPQMGQLRIDSEKLILTFPHLFRTTLFLAHAQANIDWQNLPTGYKINASGVDVDNDDAKFKGDLSLWLPKNQQSPFINLFGEFTLNPNPHIANYLPTVIMKPNLIKWLDQAFPALESGKGTVVLRGNLNDFPFPKKEGTFAVHSQLHHVDFRYLPNWPAAQQLVANLNFDGPKVSVAIQSGKLFNSQIKSAYGEIPVLLKGIDAKLNVKADVIGDLRDGMRLINNSPLRDKFGSTISQLKIDGDAQTKINLQVDLENEQVPTQVFGNIDMSEATLILPFKQLTFENMAGILHFTQTGLQTSQLHAEFLHKPITIAIQNDNHTQTSFSFDGKTRIVDIQKAFNLPQSNNWSGYFTYQTKLVIPHDPKKPNQLQLSSDLKGIKLNLPSPFGKSPNTSAPSFLHVNFSTTQPPNIDFNYADKLNGVLQYHNKNFDFERGTILIGNNEEPSLPKQTGLWIEGEVDQFDLSEWKHFFHVQEKSKNTDSLTLLDSLKQAHLHFKQFKLFNQTLENAELTLSRQEKKWQVAIQNAVMTGQITIPDKEDEMWQARFDKFYLINTTNKKSKVTPDDIPALNFLSRDFRYNSKPFGQVQLITAPSEDGLTIERLAIQSPAFSLFAKGSWDISEKQPSTHLAGQLLIHDLGNLLTRFDMPPSIVSNNGKLLFNLAWSAAPYEPSLPLLIGQLDLTLENGRIVNIDEATSQKMGIGKLLNFFSLQNLPRHLTLDFSDVSKGGFLFDRMHGHFHLKNGNAYTKDTDWDGAVAYITMKGNMSLAAKNYDLYLSVTPHLTSSLPMVATIAGGPVVGLTTWVADKLLSKPVGKLMTYSYHMSGPWSDPRLLRISDESVRN